jgi:hypothetical protein
MAVHAKDGTRHHSAGRASLHDSLSEGKGKATVTPMKRPESGDPAAATKGGAIPQDHPHMPGPHQTPTETPIAEHVQAHGPATHTFHAEHEGKHHVTSHHGGIGKNMHHSVHESVGAARDHMASAMGEESPDHEAEETPGYEAAEEANAGGGKIPGLA